MAVLILTVPDNPTGTVAPAALLQAVCAVAERHQLAIICDQIYAELAHDVTSPSAATYLPERTIITTGLSKSLALGGWRIGYLRTPTGPWGERMRRDLTAIASEVWSALAAPMQAVAGYALADPPEVLERIAASRRLHARITGLVHTDLLAAGADCRPPAAGFYLYPDFGPLRAPLGKVDITTSSELATALLHRHDIAVLPGSVFGDPERTLTIRIATSLLYGTTTDQREPP